MDTRDALQKDDSYYLLSRPELIPFLPKNLESMRVLEIGCGAGNFGAHFECMEYWGIEPNEGMAKHARLILNKVLLGNYDEVSDLLPDHYFDLVVCNDVIEHMQDVDHFLNSIKQKLKQDGLLLGSIPNVRFVENLIRLLVFRDWKYTAWGILDKTHLRFFTAKSLKRLFIENQFQIIKFSGINPVALKFHSLKSFCINLALIICTFILGRDAQYFQFGFLIKHWPTEIDSSSTKNSLNSPT
jgi:2-polyprenyl-3-methyl-5-hydroxy-6-metoxy-1,4-benzoquinol methylase